MACSRDRQAGPATCLPVQPCLPRLALGPPPALPPPLGSCSRLGFLLQKDLSTGSSFCLQQTHPTLNSTFAVASCSHVTPREISPRPLDKIRSPVVLCISLCTTCNHFSKFYQCINTYETLGRQLPSSPSLSVFGHISGIY